MRIQAVYVTSDGRVRAEFREAEVTGRFEFSMSDRSGDLCFFMDDENEARARLAAAAFNDDLCELRRLLDIAEADAQIAEDDAETIQVEFRKCLFEISFTRAGYDVREMPPAQKSSEAATSSDYMTQARQIWTENADKHDLLRAVFKETNPLVERREIERAPEHHKEK